MKIRHNVEISCTMQFLESCMKYPEKICQKLDPSTVFLIYWICEWNKFLCFWNSCQNLGFSIRSSYFCSNYRFDSSQNFKVTTLLEFWVIKSNNTHLIFPSVCFHYDDYIHKSSNQIQRKKCVKKLIFRPFITFLGKNLTRT